MMTENKPLLTIGMIFRDNIRCIERCLKALQPLRDAIPCELIMADTGSVDGSRAVAEKYADEVFDFPWVNDFSAARNAVMDRARGKWFFTVDTDEYLDADVRQLVEFLRARRPEVMVAVIQRSYDNYEMDGTYTDFMAMRLLRMSTGVRYQGTIHESWRFSTEKVGIYAASKTILHHDGYVSTGQDSEEGKKKLRRNLDLLKEEVRQHPKSLLRYLQLLESGSNEPEFDSWVRKAVTLCKGTVYDGENNVAPILRYAVMHAQIKGLPELKEWSALLQERYPNSMFTRIDAAYFLLVQNWNDKEFAACIPIGEDILKAQAEYAAGAGTLDQLSSGILTANALYREGVKIILAGAYRHEGDPEKALALLGEVDYTELDGTNVERLLKCAQDIHTTSELDTAPLIRSIWEGISQPKPSPRRAEERIQAFFQTASEAIALRTLHVSSPGRYHSTLYLPLYGMCDVGTAAVVLETHDPQKMGCLLAGIQDWEHCSIRVLAYAIRNGMQFPLESKPMPQEELNILATRLASVDMPLCIAEVQRPVPREEPVLGWRHALAEAAVCGFDWKNAEQGMGLARAYAQTEGAYLPSKYGAEALESREIPDPHRFGFYCAQAFNALDAGDGVGYVRLLREGLSVCEDMKPMVEFLVEHTPELNVPPEPSAELKALADQIRAVLANFSPEDPAVAVLKQSEAYQKVAYLIEGVEVPVVGGLKQ